MRLEVIKVDSEAAFRKGSIARTKAETLKEYLSKDLDAVDAVLEGYHAGVREMREYLTKGLHIHFARNVNHHASSQSTVFCFFAPSLPS